MNKNIWVIQEVYYPDEVGGAYFITKLAEGLSGSYNVNVLCGYPVYTARGIMVPKHERLNGVDVRRCLATRFNKNKITLRLINLLTITISIFFHTFFRVRKHDIVLVVTTPPLLPFFISFACYMRGAKCILRIDDIYPDTLIATGHFSKENIFMKIFSYMNKILYQSFEHIVVLGRDMEHLVKKKLGSARQQITIIPNWADIDLIKPVPKEENILLNELGLNNKFIINLAGNMGLAQGIENLLKAVEILKDEDAIHFLFIGSGAKKKWMEKEINAKGLKNITLTDQLPRSEQQNFLNACDIGLITLLPGMTGAGVPSRLYNIMSAGKPIIAITGHGSESEFVIREEGIGWFVEAGDPNKLVDAILEAQSNPKKLLYMGTLSRSVAVKKYSRGKVINEYCKLIDSML